MNNLYQNIIFATDLGPQSLYIGQHAAKMATLCKAKLFALHVVEPPMTYTVEFHEREKLLKQSTQAANQSLAALCQQLKVTNIQQLVKVGTPQDEILSLSEEHQCDLIIVGSHGVGGYTHALGSTAHHLLGEARCDVLTVQVTHLKNAIAPSPSEHYLWQAIDDKKLDELNKTTSKYMGSEHGFGSEVRRGPRPTLRPGSTPFKGGTRKPRDDEDNNKE